MRLDEGEKAFPCNSIGHSLPSLACSAGAVFDPILEVNVQGKSLQLFLSLQV